MNRNNIAMLAMVISGLILGLASHFIFGTMFFGPSNSNTANVTSDMFVVGIVGTAIAIGLFPQRNQRSTLALALFLMGAGFSTLLFIGMVGIIDIRLLIIYGIIGAIGFVLYRQYQSGKQSISSLIPQNSATSTQSTQTFSVQDELEKAANLFQQGLIDEEEYKNLKSKILNAGK